ncbi:MAG: ornithine cyclodeaminase family protein [Candidatus Parcubacteria bacterium]|nr:ornithine cyclodeaminase family protein [Burkholderiales bacterium]
MATSGSFRYLSSADIDALELKVQDVADAVQAAFRALAKGEAESVPKTGFRISPSNFFHAMPARYDAMGTVGVKWVGTADNAAAGLPHINSLIVLSNAGTAVVQAVMDGTGITAIRPAAVSLVAGRHLARKDSSRMGFIACGVQALSHLDAFAAEFPVRAVACYSRRAATAEAFAAKARARGFTATVVTDPRGAVEGQDIVVSSAPRASFPAPFLDPAWLSPGAFVSAVDLARSWRCDAMRTLDLVATDNREQSEEESLQPGVLPYRGTYDADLMELVSGAHPGRTNPSQRTILIHPGLGLGDIAAAALALERAIAKGVGILLPR